LLFADDIILRLFVFKTTRLFIFNISERLISQLQNSLIKTKVKTIIMNAQYLEAEKEEN